MSVSNKFVTKEKLCRELGISASTLRFYLNTLLRKKLEENGYRITQKYLTAKQYKIVCFELNNTKDID